MGKGLKAFGQGVSAAAAFPFFVLAIDLDLKIRRITRHSVDAFISSFYSINNIRVSNKSRQKIRSF